VSTSKGKEADPRNWGDADLDEEEIDQNTQQALWEEAAVARNIQYDTGIDALQWHRGHGHCRCHVMVVVNGARSMGCGRRGEVDGAWSTGRGRRGVVDVAVRPRVVILVIDVALSSWQC